MATTTWKKAVFSSFGNPAEVLNVKDVAGVPVPQDNEIVYKVIYTPIHPSNLYFVFGSYGLSNPTLPATPGNEFVGTVVAIGKNVPADKAKLGVRYGVAASAGAWGQYSVQKWPGLHVEVPTEVPDEQAAQIFINGMTAYAMLEEVEAKSGDWVIHSASGSALGRILAQIAKAKGVNLVNIVRRQEQAKELQAAGEVAFAFDGTNHDQVLAEIKKVTGGKGPKAGFDAAGGLTGGLLLDSLAVGGTLLPYGLLEKDPTPLDNAKVLFRQLTIKGFWLVAWLTKADRSKALADYVHLLKTKQVVAPVGEIFPLTQLKEAIAESTRPGKPGKVLLKP